ncbi:AT-hook motif nuclear-localized protein 11-like isoform X1 [Cicer arietinum]|uniref:AT-hook motif nuclear-localized protein n=2 Tax=Cicer arietinum TaxID=3827 RepID=A0A1S2XS40_CICAR|nr:AT-hook motif nuclear-localized protein 9-like isoform X1 [Cicer arietinum]
MYSLVNIGDQNFLSKKAFEVKCMDHVDHMALSGSASYYMQQQRELAVSGPLPELHVSPSIRPLSNPNNLPFQSNIGGGHIGSSLPLESLAISSHAVNVDGPTGVSTGETVKRKRGRPRKYGSDRVVSLALSPSTTPSSNPITVTQDGQKRGRGRPPGSGKKQQLASSGESIPDSAGIGFAPHVIQIPSGEDIAAKILAFSQMQAKALCVMAAEGHVSIATLRQPSTSGGTVKFEGNLELLSMSGSYLPTDSGSLRNRTGGLSVTLVSPDGRVVGGGIGGVLIASDLVKVTVGTFQWGRLKGKYKKKGSSQDASVVAVESDHQGIHNPVALNSILPNQQNLTSPTSSLSPWSASRPMDMRNSHVDIDLMRG